MRFVIERRDRNRCGCGGAVRGGGRSGSEYGIAMGSVDRCGVDVVEWRLRLVVAREIARGFPAGVRIETDLGETEISAIVISSDALY